MVQQSDCYIILLTLHSYPWNQVPGQPWKYDLSAAPITTEMAVGEGGDLQTDIRFAQRYTNPGIAKATITKRLKSYPKTQQEAIDINHQRGGYYGGKWISRIEIRRVLDIDSIPHLKIR